MNSVPQSGPARTVVLEDVCDLQYTGARDYIDYPLDIPAGVSLIDVQLDFIKVTDRFQLYEALLEPSGLLRGHVQCPGGPGPRHQRFTVGEATASHGCIAGRIMAGNWTLRIDLDRFRESGHYELRVVTQTDQRQEALESREPGAPSITSPESRATPDQPPADTQSHWLKGELHSHSFHSDGRNSVLEIIAEARRLKLDFFALSDHFTWSHWADLSADDANGVESPLILLPSIEVTTHLGHANAHGLTQWPNVYVDGGGWNCGDLARSVHDQGGLFGINHPFSGQQAWRRSDVAWSEVDLLEVVNQSQDANNDAAIGLWDRLLAQGYDIAPVAGTDCHDIGDPPQRLGQVFTFVKAADYTLPAVINGLRNGATVVSRGARLDLSIRHQATVARLGETIHAGSSPVQLEIEIDAEHRCTLYVIRDGLMWHQSDVKPGPQFVVLDDPHPISGAYRVELHRRSSDPRHWASAWRSHESFEALTGHIRVFADSDNLPDV
ncbi:MAG: CehA/McbA family metallohydrolase [Lacisediminihabitans sp.]